MNDTELIHELSKIIDENQIISSSKKLAVYDCDGYVAQKSRARLAVYPESTEEVAGIVRLLHKHEIPFLPRGAGTGLSGGAIPMNREVIVNLVRMNKLLSVDFDNMRAVVQPGHVNIMLTKKIGRDGWYYAPDPSSQTACTIGGNLAENAGGAHCLKYGVTTNHVVAATVVLPDGEVVKMGSEFGEPIGYDLMGLLVGAEGTLGIATEIVVKILKKPEAVKTIMAMFNRVEEASNTVSDVISAGVIPAAMEMMDQLAMQAVDKSNYHVGYPNDIEAVLLIEVDGMAAGLDASARQIVEICEKNSVRTVKVAQSDTERSLWWSSRKMAFGAMGRISPDYVVQDGVIPRSKLTQVLRQIKGLSEETGLRIANVFHAGDGNLHPLICYDSRVPGETELALETGSKILKICVDAGGTISGEHGIGIEKIEDMNYLYTKHDLDAQISVRSVFNPRDLCNSGKLIPHPSKCAEVRQAQQVIKENGHIFDTLPDQTTFSS
ncbi:FAD-linked oxidase C-terminal domain-containing protein [Alicyclobacillus sp. SO9]|uniref:FAD-linked oxidase C-terminal domain-containing protein n=1 Tax=Alicyclobacillus sp. SO9 TaxID=2665646 RepID=UPI00351C9F0B